LPPVFRPTGDKIAGAAYSTYKSRAKSLSLASLMVMDLAELVMASGLGDWYSKVARMR